MKNCDGFSVHFPPSLDRELCLAACCRIRSTRPFSGPKIVHILTLSPSSSASRQNRHASSAKSNSSRFLQSTIFSNRHTSEIDDKLLPVLPSEDRFRHIPLADENTKLPVLQAQLPQRNPLHIKPTPFRAQPIRKPLLLDSKFRTKQYHTMPGPAPKEIQLPVPNPTPTGNSRRGSMAVGPKSTLNEGHGAYEAELRKEMTLLAEAAKRAAMATVVQDLKDCSV